MIRIKALHMEYNGDPVLKNIHLHIQPGEFVFLQGPSGSGKSTLLKLLYRDLEVFRGEIFIDNIPIRSKPKYMTRREVGTIFQSFELLERKTALENVVLAGEVLGRPEGEIREEAMVLFERIGLKGKEERFPHQLSGGEQQRIAIARALLNRPKILLADEPTGNLDVQNAIIVMDLLKEINQEDHITMLVVTHSQELTRMFPARRLVMEDGKVKEFANF